MTELSFDGRVALVTGAGRGLGRAYALLLGALGAAVVVNDFGGSLTGSEPSAGPADGVVAEIRAAGGKAVANHASVADAAGARSIVDDALVHFGQLDIVINNAGVSWANPFETTVLDDFRRMLDVHLLGAVAVTQAAWPHLKAAGYGRIVNTVSTSVFGIAGWSAYGAAKGAVFGLTRALCLEAPDGVLINAIAPAAATRQFFASGLGPDAPPAVLEQMLSPAKVAPVVAFLAHESCALQGQVLTGAGGGVARWLIGETGGYADPDLRPEAVATHLPQILSEASFEPFASGLHVRASAAGVLNSVF